MKKSYTLNCLKKFTQNELIDICKKRGIKETQYDQMINYLVRDIVSKNENFTYQGYLEIVNGYGFLRSMENNFLPSCYDIYISNKVIKDNQLRMGDYVICTVTTPAQYDDTKPLAAGNILSVNDREPGYIRLQFEKLTAIYPDEQIRLSTYEDPNYSLCSRLIDLFIPQGFGHRSLVIAPPKTGKTTILHSIGVGIANNYPDKKLIVLLVDERPEEVTEFKKLLPNAIIISSTFDEPPENHARASEMTREYARRLVEDGQDVVIILDSITRLVRSYNAITPSSGKVLSGGMEPSAVQKPKKFFGSARNTEESGSLTIIGSALTETGSRLDEYILEEFVGTGNSQIYLDRKLAEKRIFPAINLRQSSTRKIETMKVVRNLDGNGTIEIQGGPRRSLETYVARSDNPEIIKSISDKLKETKSNEIFLSIITQSPHKRYE